MADSEDFFKPGSPAAKLSSAEKAAFTDRSAKGILSAEVAAREEKTARLRRLRLEQEESAAAAASSKTK